MDIQENIEEEIKIAAQVLDILAKNKCSVAETEAVLHIVTAKVKDSATLHEADYLEELIQDFDRPVPPRLRQFYQR